MNGLLDCYKAPDSSHKTNKMDLQSGLIPKPSQFIRKQNVGYDPETVKPYNSSGTSQISDGPQGGRRQSSYPKTVNIKGEVDLNAQEMLDLCVSKIRKKKMNGAPLEFVSLDLEMTGITKEKNMGKKDTTLAQYYRHQMEGAAAFGIVQLGVCLASRRPSKKKPNKDIYKDITPAVRGILPNKDPPPVIISEEDPYGNDTYNIDCYNEGELSEGQWCGNPFDNIGTETASRNRSKSDDELTLVTDVVDSKSGNDIGDDGDDKGGWVLEPYNFYLYPKRRRIFLSDTKSFKFLHKSGFSFDTWIADGLDYEAVNDIAIDKRMIKEKRVIATEVIESGAQRVIESIMEVGLPLVLHNGLLDLLHVVDKFIVRLDPARTGMQDFADLIGKFFPGGIFDTKHIAKQKLVSPWLDSSLFCDSAATALAALAVSYTKDVKKKERNGFSVEIHGSFSNRYTGDSKLHEAGYDAMLTAKVFLLQLQYLMSATKSQSDRYYTCQFNGRRPCENCKTKGICEDWILMAKGEAWWNYLDVVVGGEGFVLGKKGNKRPYVDQAKEVKMMYSKRGTLHLGNHYYSNKSWSKKNSN